MNDSDQKLLRETIEARLGEQMSSIDTFTTRAGLVLATCGVIFTGYMQLLAANSWMVKYGSGYFLLEVVAIALAGFFAFAALVPGGEKGRWRHDPDPEKLYLLSQKEDSIDIQDEVLKSIIAAYNYNRKVFEEKFRLLRYSRYALYASGSIFLLHLLIFLS